MPDEAPNAAGENPTGDEGGGGGSLHPAYVRKLEKQAKDAQKRAQELEGRLADFDKLSSRAARYDEMITSEIDSTLGGFSEDVRAAADSVLSKLADPLDRREALRAFQSIASQKAGPRPADVPRGSPPPPARGVEHYRQNPSEVRNAPKEVRDQILREGGFTPGGRNPWSR